MKKICAGFVRKKRKETPFSKKTKDGVFFPS
jgi:hypothetical protein